MAHREMSRIIAEKRKESGYTQQQLAERLHISPQAVSKWEIFLQFYDV